MESYEFSRLLWEMGYSESFLPFSLWKGGRTLPFLLRLTTYLEVVLEADEEGE